MKQSIFITFFVTFFSSPLSAFSLNWLQPMIDSESPVWRLEQLQDSMTLYDCGLEAENREFCSDIVKYYNVDIESRLFVSDGLVNKISLTAPFSQSAYTELQLNLRKDGYVLSKAQIKGKHFDVIAELEHTPIKVVNRQVVMFLNDGPISSDREFTWYPNSEYYQENPSRYALFTSGLEGIELVFYRLR